MKTALKVISVILAFALVACCFASCKQNENNPSDSAPSGTAAKGVAKVIPISLTEEQYGLAVAKNDAELLKAVNEFIAEIKKDGTFDAIVNKYFQDGKPEGIESAKLDKSKDQLVVATNAEFAPFEYKDGDKFLGVDLEIAAALAKKLGKELVIKDVDFDSVLNEVESGNANMAAAGLTVNEDRKKQVNFSETYYTASQYLVTPASDTKFDGCKTKEDVEKLLGELGKDVKIGFQNGTTGQYYVSGSSDYPGLGVTPAGFDSGALAAQAMANGNIQYVIIDAAPAQVIVDTLNKAG